MEKLIRDISRARKRLISRARSKGVWENFGMVEVDRLVEKHIDISDYGPDMWKKRAMLTDFDEWCQNYTGRDES